MSKEFEIINNVLCLFPDNGTEMFGLQKFFGSIDGDMSLSVFIREHLSIESDRIMFSERD